MMQRIIPRASNYLVSRVTAASTRPTEPNDVIPPKMPTSDYTQLSYADPSAEEILSKRRKYLSLAVFHFYNKLLSFVDGKMQYLFDDKGRRYLDAFGGIATVCCGHCLPDVEEAIVNQTKRLQHSTILYHFVLESCHSGFCGGSGGKIPQ